MRVDRSFSRWHYSGLKYCNSRLKHWLLLYNKHPTYTRMTIVASSVSLSPLLSLQNCPSRFFLFFLPFFNKEPVLTTPEACYYLLLQHRIRTPGASTIHRRPTTTYTRRSFSRRRPTRTTTYIQYGCFEVLQQQYCTSLRHEVHHHYSSATTDTLSAEEDRPFSGFRLDRWLASSVYSLYNTKNRGRQGQHKKMNRIKGGKVSQRGDTCRHVLLSLLSNLILL